ncbi:hypothetical protein NYZ99_15365 [Maribacter litopenaei]|uniref:Transposase n=1 Tax=Maribacter litopenaei TaxID=2976127 RepID=A0ABY5Y7H8_9FLAO|nr:hypothetical protein [Maribacter litopenaei]UWX54317.1 hypothetical protein NYZ99_15365 [Maribacter litopenaei]
MFWSSKTVYFYEVMLAHFDVIIHTMKNRGGRKPLGDKKRKHSFKVRMNQAEVERLSALMKRFHLGHG